MQTEDFDVGCETTRLHEMNLSIGAIATFVGTVSDVNENAQIVSLRLEHYPGMTEKSIAEIIQQAKQRWPLLGVRVIHRVGELKLGEQIVFVGVSSRHRGAAFDACEFIMDYLKTRAPFWKKETTRSGTRWVESRASDSDAAERWQSNEAPIQFPLPPGEG